MTIRTIPLAAASLCLILFSATPRHAEACTSILVTPGAAADGASMITYSADSSTLYGSLSHLPAAHHAPGATRPIHDVDSGDFLGTIPEAPQTYAVMGYMNEHQLAIGETTFGGRPELQDPLGVIDYGSLMVLALQRARTAREAIDVMTSLVAEHGYRSGGESFSLADPKEVWILELIGRGPGNKGALWVARRVPDGYLAAHANQARIQDFPRNDPKNCLYSPDLVDFARERGWFEGADKDFRFADTYNPMDYGGLRICEARVWSVFRRAAPSREWPVSQVIDPAAATPLPLWIKPERKLAVQDVMALMRDHYQGTPLDLTKGVAAGPYASPYRWRPLYWKLDDVTYMNDRPISTQQTGFSFVTQSRAALPDIIGGIYWFGVDDTFTTVYVPVYASALSAPAPFRPEVASLSRFSWDSAFWLFNWVSDMAYHRWSLMIDEIQRVQRELEGGFQARQAEVEAAAKELWTRSPGLAREYLSRYSHEATGEVMARWRALGEHLFVKHVDGFVKDEHGGVQQVGYPEDFRRRIVAESGDFLRVQTMPTELPSERPTPPAGYYHSREDLGAYAVAVPEDFPFATEKLFFWPGHDRCQRPPRCCATATATEDGRHLRVTPPASQDEACGTPNWLVRVPRDERRPVLSPVGGH